MRSNGGRSEKLWRVGKSEEVGFKDFRNGSIRRQITISTKIIFDLCTLALTVSKILTFDVFDLEKVGQDHEIVPS